MNPLLLQALKALEQPTQAGKSKGKAKEGTSKTGQTKDDEDANEDEAEDSVSDPEA